jgi:prophage tail gpP-like protein
VRLLCGRLTSYTRVVGDSDAAVAVKGHSGHLAGTSRSVLVVTVVTRHRVIVIIIDVSAGVLILQQTDRRSARSALNESKSIQSDFTNNKIKQQPIFTNGTKVPYA